MSGGDVAELLGPRVGAGGEERHEAAPAEIAERESVQSREDLGQVAGLDQQGAQEGAARGHDERGPEAVSRDVSDGDEERAAAALHQRRARREVDVVPARFVAGGGSGRHPEAAHPGVRRNERALDLARDE